ncbi:MAG: hypothetical protein K2H32_08425 [Muribaculaceae bacterium]|nr:hypothetical protein [Muribaculaceae bacterium]
MDNDIYDPLDEYVNVFKERFKEVAHSTFEELAAEANVDVDANRATCAEIYKTQDTITDLKNRIGLWTFLCVVLWLLFAGSIIYAYICFKDNVIQNGIVCVVAAILLFCLLIINIHPKLKNLKSDHAKFTAICDELIKKAWDQMAPLNRLYDWDIFARMMSRTIPKLEFDPYFTTQRLVDLKEVYNWDESFNEGRSVLYSHSGLIRGNPFVLCRTKKMEWGTKTYHGTKTIHWTETEFDSKGRAHRVHRSEVLHASVTAPFPLYFQKTRLIYGNTAAPDLVFTRKQSGFASKEGTLSHKLKKRALRKKARNLTDNDYAMMSNEDFEVAFDTSDRNNNQQFALLFTPLAQNNMLNILKDKEVGFGDDFSFEKNRMINVITSDHIQGKNLEMNPAQYQGFDYDKATEDFYKINAEHFRSIYFAFAPLLCVPMYQQIRSYENIYGHDFKRESTYWEHEALANFWGIQNFMHPDCVTDCILKTKREYTSDDETAITVYAYGYRVEQRLTYVEKWGGDGRMHRVPVYWDEYLPVTGSRNLFIKEDGDFKDEDVSNAQRRAHVENILSKTNHKIYRRHISSRLG